MNKQWKKQAATLMVAAIAVSGGAAAYAAPQAGGSQEQKPVVISAVIDYGVLVNGKEVYERRREAGHDPAAERIRDARI
ncbi:hypothetical protein [Paenibacillus sp. ISL-20]|uniref:hypothetical protein n=1 Tax=Paenibacillus sp. ISL-20 TaxID=2819163 RepID=UPI002035C8D6|nr:hypothetical protein [Paenibacillus sp. ISL-20]